MALCRGICLIPRYVTLVRVRRKPQRVVILPWLPKVTARSEAFWAPVRLWYTWQYENLPAVQVWGDPVPCDRGQPEWQWPPTRKGAPVWGWRGLAVCLATRKWLRRQGRSGWVPQPVYDKLRRVVSGERRWGVPMTRQITQAIRDVAVRRERRAKPMAMRIGQGGLRMGWRR